MDSEGTETSAAPSARWVREQLLVKGRLQGLPVASASALLDECAWKCGDAHAAWRYFGEDLPRVTNNLFATLEAMELQAMDTLEADAQPQILAKAVKLAGKLAAAHGWPRDFVRRRIKAWQGDAFVCVATLDALSHAARQRRPDAHVARQRGPAAPATDAPPPAAEGTAISAPATAVAAQAAEGESAPARLRWFEFTSSSDFLELVSPVRPAGVEQAVAHEQVVWPFQEELFVSVWVRPRRIDHEGKAYVLALTTQYGGGVSLTMGAQGRVYVKIADDSTEAPGVSRAREVRTAEGAVAAGRWSHLAIRLSAPAGRKKRDVAAETGARFRDTFARWRGSSVANAGGEKSSLELWVDGVAHQSCPATAPRLRNRAHPLAVASLGEHLDGAMGSLLILSHAPSPASVVAMYVAGKRGRGSIEGDFSALAACRTAADADTTPTGAQQKKPPRAGGGAGLVSLVSAGFCFSEPAPDFDRSFVGDWSYVLRGATVACACDAAADSLRQFGGAAALLPLVAQLCDEKLLEREHAARILARKSGPGAVGSRLFALAAVLRGDSELQHDFCAVGGPELLEACLQSRGRGIRALECGSFEDACAMCVLVDAALDGGCGPLATRLLRIAFDASLWTARGDAFCADAEASNAALFSALGDWATSSERRWDAFSTEVGVQRFLFSCDDRCRGAETGVELARLPVQLPWAHLEPSDRTAGSPPWDEAPSDGSGGTSEARASAARCVLGLCRAKLSRLPAFCKDALFFAVACGDDALAAAAFDACADCANGNADAVATLADAAKTMLSEPAGDARAIARIVVTRLFSRRPRSSGVVHAGARLMRAALGPAAAADELGNALAIDAAQHGEVDGAALESVLSCGELTCAVVSAARVSSMLTHMQRGLVLDSVLLAKDDVWQHASLEAAAILLAGHLTDAGPRGLDAAPSDEPPREATAGAQAAALQRDVDALAVLLLASVTGASSRAFAFAARSGLRGRDLSLLSAMLRRTHDGTRDGSQKEPRLLAALSAAAPCIAAVLCDTAQRGAAAVEPVVSKRRLSRLAPDKIGSFSDEEGTDDDNPRDESTDDADSPGGRARDAVAGSPKSSPTRKSPLMACAHRRRENRRPRSKSLTPFAWSAPSLKTPLFVRLDGRLVALRRFGGLSWAEQRLYVATQLLQVYDGADDAEDKRTVEALAKVATFAVACPVVGRAVDFETDLAAAARLQTLAARLRDGSDALRPLAALDAAHDALKRRRDELVDRFSKRVACGLVDGPDLAGAAAPDSKRQMTRVRSETVLDEPDMMRIVDDADVPGEAHSPTTSAADAAAALVQLISGDASFLRHALVLRDVVRDAAASASLPDAVSKALGALVSCAYEVADDGWQLVQERQRRALLATQPRQRSGSFHEISANEFRGSLEPRGFETQGSFEDEEDEEVEDDDDSADPRDGVSDALRARLAAWLGSAWFASPICAALAAHGAGDAAAFLDAKRKDDQANEMALDQLERVPFEAEARSELPELPAASAAPQRSDVLRAFQKRRGLARFSADSKRARKAQAAWLNAATLLRAAWSPWCDDERPKPHSKVADHVDRLGRSFLFEADFEPFDFTTAAYAQHRNSSPTKVQKADPALVRAAPRSSAAQTPPKELLRLDALLVRKQGVVDGVAILTPKSLRFYSRAKPGATAPRWIPDVCSNTSVSRQRSKKREKTPQKHPSKLLFGAVEDGGPDAATVLDGGSSESETCGLAGLECESYTRLDVVERISVRRYLLKTCAVELYRADSTSVFLALRPPDFPKFQAALHDLEAKGELPLLGDGPESLAGFLDTKPGDDDDGAAERRRKREPHQGLQRLTEAWRSRRISNFAYLSAVNELAGRTVSDLAQWPVFPWVVADFHSDGLMVADFHAESLDDGPAFKFTKGIDDDETWDEGASSVSSPRRLKPKALRDAPGNGKEAWRDLSKPVGAHGPPSRVRAFAERYESFDDGGAGIPKFMFGSHYSCAAVVLHFLVRAEPYARLAVELQGGRFDVPDRLFDSIAEAWESCTNSMTDVRELVPELFYCADVLINANELPLGEKQKSGGAVDDVRLPPWALGDAHEFVRRHRGALESDRVSDALAGWVDLIFGFRQRGVLAVEAANVFYHLTYENAVDLDSMENEADRNATKDQIIHFGQTPPQLLIEAHPKRLSKAECGAPLFDDCLPQSEKRRPAVSQSRCYVTPCDDALLLDGGGGAQANAQATQHAKGAAATAAGANANAGFFDGLSRPFAALRTRAETRSTRSPAIVQIHLYGKDKLVGVFADRSIVTWRWSEMPDGRGLPCTLRPERRRSLSTDDARRAGAEPAWTAGAHVALLRDARVASVGHVDGRVRLHDADGAVLGCARGAHPHPGASIVVSDDLGLTNRSSLFITGAADGSLCVWTAAHAPLAKALDSLGGDARYGGTFDDDDANSDSVVPPSRSVVRAAAAAAAPPSVKGAKAEAQLVCTHVLFGHAHAISALAYSNVLDVAVSGAVDGTVCLHTARAGKFVRRMSFAPQIECLAVAEVSCEVAVYSRSQRTLALATLSGHMRRSTSTDSPYVSLRCTRDAARLICAGNESLDVRLLHTLEVLHSIALPQAPLSLSLSPDDKFLFLPASEASLVVCCNPKTKLIQLDVVMSTTFF